MEEKFFSNLLVEVKKWFILKMILKRTQKKKRRLKSKRSLSKRLKLFQLKRQYQK